MPTFNTYQPIVAETPLARKWFVRALIASLAIHAGLFFFFRSTKLENFSPYTERLVKREFTSLGRVDIDSKLLDAEPEMPAADQKSQKETPSIAIPDEKPSVEDTPGEMVYKPTAPEMVKPITSDKPKVDNTNLQTLEKIQQDSTKDLDKDLNSVREQLIKDKPKATSNSLLKLSETTKNGNPTSKTGGGAIPGTKSLDDALTGTGGGLQSGDKIGIRGGALFEYDKADLRTDAIIDLQKLATIVKRYPRAIFTIEGYADSIGSPDYNLALSQRRAEAVKAWLLVNIGVNPFKIEAIGRGSTNYVVLPGGGTDKAEQDRQEKNRRVEIGIKFPR